MQINSRKNPITKREDERGDSFARRVRCRPATDQCPSNVNQTLREFRPARHQTNTIFGSRTFAVKTILEKKNRC